MPTIDTLFPSGAIFLHFKVSLEMRLLKKIAYFLGDFLGWITGKTHRQKLLCGS